MSTRCVDETVADRRCSGAGAWSSHELAHPRTCIRLGVMGGGIAIYLCLVGIVPVFAERPLIVGIVELGQAALLITFAAVAYLAAGPFAATSRVRVRRRPGAFAGALTGAFLTGAGPARLGDRHPGGLPQRLARPVRPADQRQRHVVGLVPDPRRRDHRRGRRRRHLAADRLPRPAHLEPRDAGVLRAVRRPAADADAGLPADRRPGPVPVRLGRPAPDRRLDRLLRARSASCCWSARPTRGSAWTPCRRPSAGSSSARWPSWSWPSSCSSRWRWARSSPRSSRSSRCSSCSASASTSPSAWPASSTWASWRSTPSAPTRWRS